MAALADRYPERRQQCIIVLCAYVRLPTTSPRPGALLDTTTTTTVEHSSKGPGLLERRDEHAFLVDVCISVVLGQVSAKISGGRGLIEGGWCGMAAGRGTGLADEQVAQLRGSVAAGGRPRVRVSGAQFPVGTTGVVIRVGEPAADGADFVTVRVKVSGVVDELPFAPAELSMAGRGHPQEAGVEVPRGTAKAPAPRTARSGKSVALAPAEAAERSDAAEAGSPTRPAASAATGAARGSSREPAAAKSGSRSARRAGSVPPVTVTLTSVGTSWTVTAHRGAKVVVKNCAVTPGMVSAVAAMLGLPLVEEAVAAVNDTARSEAESRAEQLRAELAEVEAVLAGHRKP